MHDFYEDNKELTYQKKSLGVPEDPGHFSEVVEVLECLSSLEIFLYDFYKTPGVAGVPEYFSEVLKATECQSSL